MSGTKKEQVEQMFNSIAPKYDLLNHLLSIGIDKIWRKKVRLLITKKLQKDINKKIKHKLLDIATGTGDLAIELSKIHNIEIEGIDISTNMIEIAKKKVASKNLQNHISFNIADVENMNYQTSSFDAASVAFGVRNFENLEKGLAEIYRILKLNGYLFILEFSSPTFFPLKQLYWFYFKRVLPFIGSIISKDKKAYAYLPQSVKEFPESNHFITILKSAGFNNTEFKILSFGIATIYIGQKPK